MKASALEMMNKEDKDRVIQDRREKDRFRKQKSRAKLAEIRTPPHDPAKVSKPYSWRSSLNRAINNVKKVLPKSPRKKNIVIRKLVDEYGEIENENVKRRHLVTLGRVDRGSQKLLFVMTSVEWLGAS